jgi:hypothetical protein
VRLTRILQECGLRATKLGRYPQLGVVFDGFSIPADRSEASEKVEYASIIDEENAVVDVVRSANSGTFFKMRCRNSTSRGFSRPAEKLVWRSVALEP